ncbi:MAG: choice-of-anchor P family protein [Marmoricola sp.]
MKLRTAAIAGALAVVATMAPSVAQATTPTFGYGGYAGGTQVSAVGLTVTSDLTAESEVIGVGNQAQTNNVASVKVTGLVSVGAVKTDATGSNFGDGAKLVTHARTAGVSLLGGAIQAEAIDTTATAFANTTTPPTASTTTTFLGLKIGGKAYPVNVAPNTTVNIPGVAKVVINQTVSAADDTSAVTIGSGLSVTLLQARSGAAAGAQITVNPVYAKVLQSANVNQGAPVGGYAYGSYVNAQVGNAVQVESGQTAMNSLPSFGTNGANITNSTAKAYLQGVLNLGVIQTNGSGIQTSALSDALENAKVAGLNLFNGLITAQAIGSTAHVRLTGGFGGTPLTEGSTDFINLKIAGKPISINVAPNTKINVAGLGLVTINEQQSAVTPKGIAEKVIALHIVLSTARAGLPVGANIEIGTSGVVIFTG